MLHVRVPVHAVLPRLVFLESHWDVRVPDPTSHWEAFCVLTSLKLMHSGHTDCPSLVLPNPGSNSGPSDLNPILIDSQCAQIGLVLNREGICVRARKMRPEYRGRHL